MALNCGLSMLKYILFIFNLLCSLCGLALITIGGLAIAQMGDYHKVAEDTNIAAFAITLIIFGSIVFIISFFGCCGAIRESYCMTSTYSFFLILLVVAQVVIAVFIFMYKEETEDVVRKTFDNIFDNRDQAANMKFVDSIQENLKCCGKNSAIDYLSIKIPDSCLNSHGIPYLSGCDKALTEFISNGSKVLGYVSIGVAVIELIALISACCVANGIRNQERRYA